MHEATSRWRLTEAVEAERSIVEEVADVSGLWGHGAEDVSAAGGEGVNADEQHVDQQRPGVAVAQEVHGGAEQEEPPQEVPARNKTSWFEASSKDNDTTSVLHKTDFMNESEPYHVGKKWVQMLTVSLFIWKLLRRQSRAELRG